MLNYEFPPIGGGTGNACYYMLKEFATYPDLIIDLVTFSPDNITRTEAFAPNIQIHYVACGPKRALHHWKMSELARWLINTWRFLRKHLRRNNYDLIHCWSGWPAGILGYLFRSHAPYIIALRGSDVPGHTPRTRLLDSIIMRRLSRRVWSRAAAVTSVSNYLADLARKTLPSGKIIVINNGIDTKEFYPAEQPSAPYPVKLLYVGRLSPHKGIDDLLAALTLLIKEIGAETSDKVQLTVVGGGSLEQEMREYIRLNDLDKIVTMRGIVKHERLPSIYREHDVLVFPCHSDAMANVILEAIASGLAIISTKTGGAELIDGNGLLINALDPGDLKSKTLNLIQDANLLIRFKQRSIDSTSNLRWNSCCAKYFNTYNYCSSN